MSRKYKLNDNDKLYFIPFAVVYWIDVFIREEYSQTKIESWKHCQEKKGLEIYSWSRLRRDDESCAYDNRK
jgi:putative transposase